MDKTFWKATAVRALRTVCQTAIALIPASALITEVDWSLVASASILAGIVSVLTSIATGLPEVDNNSLYITDDDFDEENGEIEDLEEEENEENEY